MTLPETQVDDRRRKLVVSVVGALLLACALFVLVAAPIFKKTVAGPPIFDAKWTALPTPKDVKDIYPEKARAAKVTGDIKVEMHCEVVAGGAIGNCAILSESPASYGFGDAALALSPKFKLKDTAADGSSLVGLPITIPIRFEAR